MARLLSGAAPLHSMHRTRFITMYIRFLNSARPIPSPTPPGLVMLGFGFVSLLVQSAVGMYNAIPKLINLVMVLRERGCCGSGAKADPLKSFPPASYPIGPLILNPGAPLPAPRLSEAAEVAAPPVVGIEAPAYAPHNPSYFYFGAPTAAEYPPDYRPQPGSVEHVYI